MQDIMTVNFYFFGKKLILFLAFMWAIYYVFIFWKNKEETPFLFAAYARGILWVVSVIYLISMPLFVFFLYPQLPLDNILYFMLMFYIIGWFIVFVILMINIIYAPATFFGKLVGFDPLAKKADSFGKLFGIKNPINFKRWK